VILKTIYERCFHLFKKVDLLKSQKVLANNTVLLDLQMILSSYMGYYYPFYLQLSV
jgi:hypothetical protein